MPQDVLYGVFSFPCRVEVSPLAMLIASRRAFLGTVALNSGSNYTCDGFQVAVSLYVACVSENIDPLCL